jgi:hypothetical protein
VNGNHDESVFRVQLKVAEAVAEIVKRFLTKIFAPLKTSIWQMRISGCGGL